MAYKKYIKKGGKLYGPYIYHSRRVNGKVISEYHGVKRTPDYKKFALIFFGIFSIIVLVCVFMFSNKQISGKAVLDLEADYQKGQPLKGNLKLSLKRGELIPSSSKIIFKTSNQTYEYDLEKIVSDRPIEGGFYIEGKSLSGRGLGYGVAGERRIYPIVYFTLSVYSKTTLGGGESETQVEINRTEQDVEITKTNQTSGEDSQINEIDSEQEQIVNKTVAKEEESEITENLTSEIESTTTKTSEEITEQTEQENQQIIEETIQTPKENSEENKEPEQAQEIASETSEQETPITGSVISGLFKGISNSFLRLTGQVSMEFGTEIKGSVSANNSFIYNLEPGQTAEVLPRSVRTDSEKLPDNTIKLSIEENKVIVTTNYSEVEKGFGEDYLKDDEKTLVIDLSDLDLIMEPGELSISLVCNDKEEIVSLTTFLEEGKIKANKSFKKEIIPDKKIESEIITKNKTIDKGILVNMTDVAEFSNVLDDKEREILVKKFGNSSIRRTARLVNGRIIVRYELKTFWIEYSYDADSGDLDSLMEIDRIKWLKDLAKQLSQKKTAPKTIENFSKNYVI